MEIDAYEMARRFLGVHEIPGKENHPIISFAFSLTTYSGGGLHTQDAVPWCSAFVNLVAWLLGVPRSESALARSWLKVGRPVTIEEAKVGWDVVVLWRGAPNGPQGHVGFFSGWRGDGVVLLGGNQNSEVNVTTFPRDRILGIRRLLG